MKIANLLVIALGSVLVLGALNKRFVKVARKIGSWFLPFAPGHTVLNDIMNEKEKDKTAKLLLVGFGGLLILISILVIVLK